MKSYCSEGCCARLEEARALLARCVEDGVGIHQTIVKVRAFLDPRRDKSCGPEPVTSVPTTPLMGAGGAAGRDRCLCDEMGISAACEKEGHPRRDEARRCTCIGTPEPGCPCCNGDDHHRGCPARDEAPVQMEVPDRKPLAEMFKARDEARGLSTPSTVEGTSKLDANSRDEARRARVKEGIKRIVEKNGPMLARLADGPRDEARGAGECECPVEGHNPGCERDPLIRAARAAPTEPAPEWTWETWQAPPGWHVVSRAVDGVTIARDGPIKSYITLAPEPPRCTCSKIPLDFDKPHAPTCPARTGRSGK